jgi:hypothetical protein
MKLLSKKKALASSWTTVFNILSGLSLLSSPNFLGDRLLDYEEDGIRTL